MEDIDWTRNLMLNSVICYDGTRLKLRQDDWKHGVSLALLATYSEDGLLEELESQVTPYLRSVYHNGLLIATRTHEIVKSIWVMKGSTVGIPSSTSTDTVKKSAMRRQIQKWVLKDYAIIDSGCSGYDRRLKDKLSDFKEFKDKECLILSPKFKFVDEDLVILRAPRKNDVYSLDLKNIIPSGGITCLVAKATEDEAVLWHRRLGHVNFKNINKLVKGNLVRGLPSKTFKLDHSCVACRKGKQHRASCKKIEDRRDIMLVQVYVDDIIFGSTKSSMVKDFEDLMQKEFKMSSMGELTFFLGLQVKQSNGGIFLSQDKYVKDILNKFDFRTIKPASTPIEAHKSLGKDEEGEDVDVHLYRSMIGCLMYLTASRPDIMFAVCLCARFQVTPKVSHLHAVKRIFRYLKHQPNLGLWYPKDSPFHLEAFSDSDYAGDNHDRRSTSGGCQYLGRRLVSWQCKKQTIVAISSTEAEYVAAASCSHPFFDDIVDKDAAVTPDLERKSDETEEVNIEEKEASNVKSGETEELDLETTQSTARQGTITPRTLNFEDEAGPSSPLRPIQVMESEEQLKAAEVLEKRLRMLIFIKSRLSHVAARPLITLCLVDPELIVHASDTNFWLTSELLLKVINDVPHIRAKVAGKKILISEATIRADLLFDDENGVDCFPKQVIWDVLRDIGYEVLSNAISWEQFGTNIASALVGLAIVFTSHFRGSRQTSRTLYHPVSLPSKYSSIGCGGITEYYPHSRLKVNAMESQGHSQLNSAAHKSAKCGSFLKVAAHSQRTASVQDVFQTSGGDEGLLDIYALNREVRRLKKQTLSQAKQIIKLKAKLKKLSKFVQPVVKHHALWVENQNLKKQKRRRKKHKKKVSSVKLGRNQDEGTLSEEALIKSDETEEVNIEEKKLLILFDAVDCFVATVHGVWRCLSACDDLNIWDMWWYIFPNVGVVARDIESGVWSVCHGGFILQIVRTLAGQVTDFAAMAYLSLRLSVPIQRISLDRVPAQSVGSSNTDVLDSTCLLVLITGTSQSRQHVITSLIHIESCKSPTKSLFDVGSSRISIFTVNT
ncbi:uncharacterized mitochondrial protein-like protein [Tanacetum coccineum]